MPQLDITSYSSQIFWLVLCFFSMYFIMSKFIAPKIGETLEQRQRKIDDNLSQAEEFKTKAEASLIQYQKKIQDAAAKAEVAFENAQSELRATMNKKQEELAEKLQKQIKDSEAEIAKNKEQALKEVSKISETIALDIVKKIGIKSVTNDDIKEAIKTLKAE